MGNVLNIKTKKYLKHQKTSDGYVRVELSNNGTSKKINVHKLVADSFIPNPNNKLFINHKNGIKNDNRITNLEWNTRSENSQHAYDIGLTKKMVGYNNPNNKLTEEQILQIFYSTDIYTQIAKKYNISKGHIYRIKNKLRWKHLTENL